MRVYRRGDPIDGDPLLYLRVAVVNSCRSMLRRMRLVRRHAEEDSPCPPLTAEEAAMLSEDRRRVLVALASLPQRRREVLVLRFYLELSEAEIAGMLNISPGTVKSTAAQGSRSSRPHAEGNVMSSQDDISRAADQFKDALNAAAAVMTVRDQPFLSRG